ncbi:uncharacterized protein LY89DRAFT_142342 [Mollisia scopiformis]|uniref:Uncharacterized protein n=1 Tax=Mollisia scopiformis TaxID=149040 RepID=A0A194X3Y8_MOLSC|nr:uncharacterized protein LY89DRAFT_142342 [Mollisia scopiformis]KUJ14532.1 hypothetical protein LY89DRAFT_142342 [Mollisia scopiformis]
MTDHNWPFIVNGTYIHVASTYSIYHLLRFSHRRKHNLILNSQEIPPPCFFISHQNSQIQTAAESNTSSACVLHSIGNLGLLSLDVGVGLCFGREHVLILGDEEDSLVSRFIIILWN